ncbi:AraC family transcriptional regulator [Martelella sp. HB161492]|uniref:helix-turn-helix domain-containing protein n=1 Tax=Martelella sp. HB161492 TaxID=2720726 RepID=UPI0015921D63|nr:AraC family transcriptional regulator [Martelella sp. HB161492]
MGYQHTMICQTEGIYPIAPVKWRGLDGLMSVYWDAEGHAGASAYYLSPDPRIVVFFNDVSSHIEMSNSHRTLDTQARPMTRAVYVPAGTPLWTRFTKWHRFSHLDLHLHEDRLLRFLVPSVGPSAARSILRRPVEIEDVGPVDTLARMIVDEVATPTRHALFAESLVGSVVTALLDFPPEAGKQSASGRLTQAQMNRLIKRYDACGSGRMTIAEMAGTIGLSESWFSTAFKQTTGKTPLQWQLTKRIQRAQELLHGTGLSVADVAAQLGFSDQAHLTKVFRQVTGDTPAAWRRMSGKAAIERKPTASARKSESIFGKHDA